MKGDFALSRVFFIIIIFMVNFNIIICYNLYGIYVEEQLSFQQMKSSCDCVFKSITTQKRRSDEA